MSAAVGARWGLPTALADASARLLIVATSGLAEFENARKFYRRAGFVQAARIKDFFAEARAYRDAKERFTATLLDTAGLVWPDLPR